MFVSFRAAILVMASLVSASVAPAQTFSSVPAVAGATPSEPLIADNEIPQPASPTLIDPSDDLVPADTPESNEVAAVPGESLAEMVARLRSTDAGSRERNCLATAIYFESKSEPLAGQLAVGEVLANRVRSGRFASSYCGVLMQRGQFSFVKGGRLPTVARTSLQWKNAVAIASIVESGLMESKAPKALFFHARHVSPSWRATRVATIGNHVFYR